jgi:3-methyladenine DNA glycosylase Tag
VFRQRTAGLIAFKTIRARAEKRKGGAEALARLMPPMPDPGALRKLNDHRVLAEMTKRIFSAGFAWSVIESKWSGFEEAFLGFEPARLLSEPDEFWHQLTKDARIVRNGAKIASVRENARFVLDVAKEHGSFGKFLSTWPPSNEVGLLEVFAKRGGRLGGATGQMLLRFLGYDAFVASKDVVACLRDVGLDIAEAPTSKRDLAKIQEQFNAWAKETGLPYRHLSLICAMSIGENYEGDRYGGDAIGGEE